MPRSSTLLHVAVLAAVVVLTLLEAPRLSGGWRWDVPNALGLVAFAGLAALMLESGAGRGRQAHEAIGWLVLVGVVGHAAWFVITDLQTVEYLKLKAPPYMLAGMASGLLLLVVTVGAVPTLRAKAYARPRTFRRWHRRLSWFCLVLAAYHMAASGFYIRLDIFRRIN